MSVELTLTMDASQALAESRRVSETLGQAFQKVTRDSDGVRAKMGQTTQGLQALGQAAAAVGAAFAAVSVAGGLAGFVRTIIEANVATQAITNTLKAVTGSTQAAAAEFGYVREQSKRLGLDLESTARQYAQLSAATAKTTLSGQATRDVFDALAGAGTVLGLSVERMNLAFLAVQQIVSKGVVSMEELRRQLGEQLPGVLNAVAEQLGKTTAQLTQMVESGTLLATDFIPALTRALRQQFGPGIADAVNSAQAQFNRLRTAWFEMRDAIGRAGLLDAVVAATQGLTTVLDRFQTLEAGTQRLILGLAATGAAFTALATVAGAASAVILAVGAAFGTAALPLTVMIAGVAALTGGFVALYARTTQQTEGLTKLQAGLTPVQRLFATLTGSSEELAKTFAEVAARTARTAQEDAYLAVALQELQRRFPDLATAVQQTGTTYSQQLDKTRAFTQELGKQREELGLLARAWEQLKGLSIGGILESLSPTRRLERFRAEQQAEREAAALAVAQQEASAFERRILEMQQQGIGAEFPGAQPGTSGVANAVEENLKAVQKLVEGYKQAEKELDPTKLTAKLEQFQTALRLLTQPPPGVTRTDILSQLGFTGPEAERQAQAYTQRLEQLVADTRNKLLGISQSTIEAQTRPAVQAAELQAQLADQRVRQLAISLEREQTLRRQALEADYRTALETTVKTQTDRTQVDRAFAIRRLEETRRAALEDQAARVQAAQITRDAELRSLDAQIREQQAMARLGPEAERQASLQITALRNQRTVRLKAYETEVQQAAKARTEAEADFERGLTAITADEVTKRISLTSQAPQRAIAATVAQLEAAKRLIQEQLKSAVQESGSGAQQARDEAVRQTQALNETIFALEAARLTREADQRKRAAELSAADREQIEIELNQQLGALATRLQQEQQGILNEGLDEQRRAYRRFVRDVEEATGDFLYNIFSGQIDSIKDLFEDLKNAFFKILADMIAKALAEPIIVPIIASLTGMLGGVGSSILGGLVGGFSPGLGQSIRQAGTGGLSNLLGIAGLGGQALNLFGPSSAIGGALNFFSGALDLAAVKLAGLFGTTFYPASFVGPVPTSAQLGMGTSVLSGISPLTALGGLAGLGGGIYSALTAQTFGGQLGGAIGAAGGAAALAAALAPALGLALSPILGPIGLAVAAIAPLLGGFLGSLGARKGPRLAIGDFGGLGIGAEEGRLTLTGDFTSQVLRAERVGGEREMQEALRNAVQTLVQGMIDTINAVAPDPEALVGEANAAIQAALRNAIILNSSSRDTITRDIAEQTRLAALQIATGLIDPLLSGFRQIGELDLDERFQRLPQAVTAMGQTLAGLTAAVQQLDQEAQTTDVQGRMHELRSALGRLRGGLVNTTAELANAMAQEVAVNLQRTVREIQSQSLAVQAIRLPLALQEPMQAIASLRQTQAALAQFGMPAEAIEPQIQALIQRIFVEIGPALNAAFSRGVEDFGEALRLALAIPADVFNLDPVWAQFRALVERFAAVFSPLSQDIATLEAALDPVDDQLAAMTRNVTELRQALADAGTDLDVALPLFDALRQAINAEMQLRQRQVEQQRALIEEQIQGYEDSIRAQEDVVRSQQAIIASSQQLAASLRTASRQGAAPQTQLDALTAEFLRLQTQLQGQTGQEALDTIADMERVLTEAQRLGQETNRLDIIAMANELLASLIPRVEAEEARARAQLSTAEQQLAVLTAQRDAAQRSLDSLQSLEAIQREALAQLRGLQDQLYALFQSSQGVQQAIGGLAPVDTQAQTVAQLQAVNQQLAFANSELSYQSRVLLGISYGVDAPSQFQSRQRGGFVSAMLEPGESVWRPQSDGQARALDALNTAFPRFGAGGWMVPGVGSGDTVPAQVPDGAFILNRHATQALTSSGFQSGGPVRLQTGGTASSGGFQGGGLTLNLNIQIDASGAVVRSDADLERLAKAVGEEIKRATDPRTLAEALERKVYGREVRGRF